jgi:hypothetical protein
MQYADAREQIKTGDMLLYRNHQGGGLRAIIERWFVSHGTASPYCHVGVAWRDGDRRLWIMDLTTKGCAPRLLSKTGAFDWAPAPAPLTDAALGYAHDCFGEWVYSRLQAVEGELDSLSIGADKKGQCAEYALSVWRASGMAPSRRATPAACADGALYTWGSSILHVEEAK